MSFFLRFHFRSFGEKFLVDPLRHRLQLMLKRAASAEALPSIFLRSRSTQLCGVCETLEFTADKALFFIVNHLSGKLTHTSYAARNKAQT